MQQFSPFPSFQQYENVDMMEEEQVIDDVFVPQSFQTTSPILISGQIPVITTEQLTAISGVSPKNTGALSLTEALQATMNAPTTGRHGRYPRFQETKEHTTGYCRFYFALKPAPASLHHYRRYLVGDYLSL